MPIGNIVDKKLKADMSFDERMNLQLSLQAFRIGAAMLGMVDPFKIEELAR